ncbi:MULTISPECIES: hypothetical protein [unclassified Commensalibacter]|uniref:hypothetical protein n=1 Tax=unclassified Commensalibacter TaxID=2630218 RepID=UPI0018DC697E|nr:MULTISPECIES: hypothetical protein [unclassified Commensalibacter]MBH9970405.1 hypothetical protein [Commensalibacter sp. M0265]MBH9977900.1 hypothetical protein [Commensalibacter sp. M0266]MBH9993440.1 hypothetical protein [Commensalibacter sp. M0270]MBI0046936.1 hypothetical protein [Commensalibacter sp. M0267]MBI0056605.1 hypothetical protein [Commensalibacter sp. M0268]
MRKLFYLLTFFPLSTFANISTASSSPDPKTYPSTIKNEEIHSIIKEKDFHDWNVIVGKNHASLNWNRNSTSNLNLYITPSEHRITLDVTAKKNTYREFKLPYITWNIREVSVTLNKTRDHNGWVTYSTAIYTDNITKFINALQHSSPMILNLSISTSIPIDMNGERSALNSFMNVIKEKNLEAPPPLVTRKTNPEPVTPPDGMSPDLVPLFQQANYYVKKCIDHASEPLNSPTRKSVCTTRNSYLKKMKDKGWCWGSGDPDQHDKNKNWRLCIMSPKGSVPKLKEKVQEDLQKAQSMMKDQI